MHHVQHEDRPGAGRFYVEHDDAQVAEMTYTRDGDVVTIRHTEVSPVLEGQGIGQRMVAAAVEWARRSSYKLEPVCSFARAVIERTAEYHDVRAPTRR